MRIWVIQLCWPEYSDYNWIYFKIHSEAIILVDLILWSITQHNHLTHSVSRYYWQCQGKNIVPIFNFFDLWFLYFGFNWAIALPEPIKEIAWVRCMSWDIGNPLPAYWSNPGSEKFKIIQIPDRMLVSFAFVRCFIIIVLIEVCFGVIVDDNAMFFDEL